MGVRERREREREGVRAKIMDAARDLFVTLGYEAVSMRKIAEAVDYSPTAIYLHFADKEALLRELCAHDFGKLASAFGAMSREADPVRRLYAVGEAYIRFAVEFPNQYRLMFMTACKHPELGPREKLVQGNPDEDAYAFLKATAAAAIAAGKFRPGLDDPDLAAQTLWACVHGVASLQIVKADDPWLQWRPLADRRRTMLESILRGFLADPDEAAEPKAPAHPKAAAQPKAAAPAGERGREVNFVALKMLIGDRLKYISLVAGLAFAALLVTQQASIFTGYALRTGSWIRDTRVADLWVMDDQAEFTEANKPILDTALTRVRRRAGRGMGGADVQGYLKCRLPDGTQIAAIASSGWTTQR